MKKKRVIYIKLFGGEQDGYDIEHEVETETSFPDVIYVHRACDSGRIKDARDPKLKRLLTDSLSILAYRFEQADMKDGVPGGRQYTYVRFAEADKAMSDPAM